MHKKYVVTALALAGATLGAQAQSNMTIYGLADAGLVLERGADAGPQQKLSSGVAQGSRLGFKSKEDLGGGTSLTVVLENGYSLDTGAAGQGGLLFGRQALLCLTGEAGALSAGRQHTPYYKVLTTVADPFATGMAGNAQNLIASTSRADNTVEYISPRVGGFTADLQYGFGEAAGSLASNNFFSASASYENGPLTLVLAQQQRENASASARSRNTMLVARYRFAAVNGHAVITHNRDVSGRASGDLLLGLTAPVGGDKLIASLIGHHDGAAARQHARQMAVGYSHPLSRRTDLYAAYAHIHNQHGAVFHVGTAVDAGSGSTGINLGMRHVF